jgi:hypothetical protein
VAAVAALTTAAGVGLIATAVVATRRLWFGGYVSEAGTADGANAAVYQAGVIAVAVGLVLTALAVAVIVPAGGWLLMIAGAFAGVSSVAPCSTGCPLPPYEPTTTADLVHAVASVLAVAGCLLAMGAIGLSPAADPSWRRVSRIAFWIVAPLVAAAAVAMLGVGRGYATGLLERVILVAVTAWLLYTGAHLTLRRYA